MRKPPAPQRDCTGQTTGASSAHRPYESSSLTLAEISLPSARPASFFEATPITLPISFIDVAPTSAITAFTSAVSSSGVRLFGQKLLVNGYLSQLLRSQVRTVLLGEDRRRIGALLGEFRDDFQHVGIGQFGDRPDLRSWLR